MISLVRLAIGFFALEKLWSHTLVQEIIEESRMVEGTSFRGSWNWTL